MSFVNLDRTTTIRGAFTGAGSRFAFAAFGLAGFGDAFTRAAFGFAGTFATGSHPGCLHPHPGVRHSPQSPRRQNEHVTVNRSIILRCSSSVIGVVAVTGPAASRFRSWP